MAIVIKFKGTVLFLEKPDRLTNAWFLDINAGIFHFNVNEPELWIITILFI